MALNAGSVFVTLGGRFEPAGFQAYGAAMNESGARMRAFERESIASQARINESMRKMGQTAKVAAAGAFVGLGAAIIGSVKVAADFDKSMRNVNSIAQLSEPAFKKLSKSVLELSGKTAQAPKTLADGMYQLVSSGFKAHESLAILKASAIAATAGMTDTATATSAVAAVLNAYHLKAKDAGTVSDQLFQTVNRGVITFDVLAHNIGQVLPFAASLGVGLDQVGASISTLTKQGLSGELAITDLKNAMSAFLKPSKGMAEAIKATGFQSGESLVKAKGFQGALEAVAATTDGSRSALTKLFPNLRSLTAAMDLTGKSTRMADGDLKAFADTTGATKRVFAEQMKSTANQWKQFTANLQAAGVVIGSQILPVLAKGVASLAKWVEHLNQTGQLARFGHEVADGFKEAGQVFSDVASAGGKVASVLLSIGRALNLGNPTNLEALLAAIAGFKIAGVVIPLVGGLAHAIRGLVIAARAGALTEFFSAMMSGGGLLTALSIGAGALGAAFVLLGGNESEETRLANENAAAKKAQAQAVQDLARAERDAASKGLAAKQADLNVKGGRQDIIMARQQLAEAKNAPDTPGKQDVVAAAHLRLSQAILTEKQAVLDASGAHRDYNAQLGQESRKAQHDIDTAYGNMQKARKSLDALNLPLQALGGKGGSGSVSPAVAAQHLKDQAHAQANLNETVQAYYQAAARANVTDLNRQRLMDQGKAITDANAQGVSSLIHTMQGLPKTVQTKLLVQNQDALAKAGDLSNTLTAMGQHHTAVKILTNAPTVKVAVAALTAAVKGVPPNKVLRIIHNADSARAAVDSLGSAIRNLPTSHTTTLTTFEKTVRSVQQGAASSSGAGFGPAPGRAPKIGGKEAGRSAGPGETALVGEGAGPEWVIDPRAGTARYVTAPTVMDLAPQDYVIPTESRYRGRALGLLADVAASIGAAAFKAGKKGKPHRFVPKPTEYLRLSPDQYQAADQNAQRHLEDLRQKAKEKDARGHHTRGALRAEKEIGGARRDRDKAHAEYLAAKRFAARLAAHEQEAEIASTLMSTADGRNDQKGYNAAKRKRESELRWALHALQYEHGKAKKGSQWERDTRQAIAQITGDLQATAQASSTPPAAPSELTVAEQARLDQINASIALASLTADRADDVAGAQALVGFLTPILASAVADPAARGGVTAITDLAGQLKSAQDNLAALTAPAASAAATDTGTADTSDLQAQLAQAVSRAQNAEAAATINAQALSVLGGPGDIGTGGSMARSAVIFQSYVPPSPSEALRLANYVVGGLDHQGITTSPRETLGV